MVARFSKFASRNSLPILLAGVGSGIVKILRDAESNATYTYFLAIFFSVFALIAIGFAVRSIWGRSDNQAETGILSQIPLLLSGGFSAWSAYEIIKRLIF